MKYKIANEKFKYFFEFYPDFKAMCKKLSLISADDVNNYLENETISFNDRLTLKSKIQYMEFIESFSSQLYVKGIESSKVEDLEDLKAIEALLEDNFWLKIKKVKEYCLNNNIEFDSLTYKSKLNIFEKVITFENNIIKDVFKRMFNRVYNKKNSKINKTLKGIKSNKDSNKDTPMK